MSMEFATKSFHTFTFRDLHFLLDIDRSLIYRLSSEAYCAFAKLAHGSTAQEGEEYAELLPILTNPGGGDAQSLALRLDERLPDQNLLWLGVTHDCNLACRYCFVDLEQSGKDMTVTTARRGIDL